MDSHGSTSWKSILPPAPNEKRAIAVGRFGQSAQRGYLPWSLLLRKRVRRKGALPFSGYCVHFSPEVFAL